MGKPYTNQEQYRKDRKAEKRLNSPRVRRQEAAFAGASSGCLMALAMLPFTALLALLKRK